MREHKVLKIILCIMAVVFIVHQVYSSVYKPITTVTAQTYTAIEGHNINAVFIREEQAVTSESTGALHFVLSDGERVSKDGIIANIYSNADISVTVSRIEQLESRIADIEQMQAYNDVEAADLTLINNKVNNSLNNMLRGVASGNFSTADADAAELLTNISRRQMITGEHTDFSARLDELKNERDNLKSSLPQPVGSITAKQSGYFVSNVDGYENSLKCDDIENITPKQLDNLKSSDTPQHTIGKIVSGYTWYIATKVDLNESVKYKVGDKLILKTTIKSSPELNVTVEKINTSKDSDSAVLIFACKQMNSELATVRKANMTIIKNTYTGLKLPTKALRFQEDKTGVFVRSGITLKFVGVEVIYRTDEYIICEQQVSDKLVLRLYDDVVVKGRKLYDGKVVD